MSLRQEDREDRIRRRAYLMWLDAGLPDGQSLAHWQAAENAEAAEEARSDATMGENFPAGDVEMPPARPDERMPGGRAALPAGSLPGPFLGPQGDEQREPPAGSPSPVPPAPVVDRQLPPAPKRRNAGR